MSILPLRPLGFGEIVDGAVQLYRRDFVLYYLIALVSALPGYLLQLFLGPNFQSLADVPDDPAAIIAWRGEMASMMAVAGVVLVGASIFSWFGWVALTVAIRERAGEREVSFGQAWRSAVPHFPGALGAGALAMLGFVVIGIVLFIVVAGLGTALSVLAGLAGTLVGLIVIWLIGAFLLLAWAGVSYGILPALVFEGRGAVGAVGRSLSLCRGGLLRVTGVVAVALIIRHAPTFGAQMLFGLNDFFGDPEAAANIGGTEQWLRNTVSYIVGSLTTPFVVGAMVVLFHDRRVRSEGFDLAARAEAMRPDDVTGR